MDKVEKSISILLDLLDENKCREFELKRIHPEPACTRCGAKVPEEKHSRFYKNLVMSCSSCHRKYFPSRGSIFHGMKISFKEFIILRLLFELGMKPAKITRILTRSKDTTNRWRKRFLAMESVNAR